MRTAWKRPSKEIPVAFYSDARQTYPISVRIQITFSPRSRHDPDPEEADFNDFRITIELRSSDANYPRDDDHLAARRMAKLRVSGHN